MFAYPAKRPLLVLVFKYLGFILEGTMRTITATLLACLAFSIDAAEYRANEVANGFQIPWGIEFLDKQQMIVNEKTAPFHYLILRRENSKPSSKYRM